jgi:hypothetical protein
MGKFWIGRLYGQSEWVVLVRVGLSVPEAGTSRQSVSFLDPTGVSSGSQQNRLEEFDARQSRL